MVSIAGSKKLKRQMAPQFWGIHRKTNRFVITVRPGAHQKHNSIPSAVFLRDTLKVVTTLREAKVSIYSGNVKIDGVQRRSLHHGIGLMDVVELANVHKVYRLVPKEGIILKYIEIDAAEKSKKLCTVTTKTSIKGSKTQLGLHDGRSIISEEKVSVGDSCLIQTPEQKILQIINMKNGAQVIVTHGVNAGQIGSISEIKKGTFVLPKMATIKLGDREIEIPTNILMAVGEDKPVIQIR